jgi:hypothetical protein
MAANRDPFSTLDPDEIQVAATAEIYSQEVRVRTSYVAEEVIFDARFANILEEEDSRTSSKRRSRAARASMSAESERSSESRRACRREASALARQRASVARRTQLTDWQRGVSWQHAAR